VSARHQAGLTQADVAEHMGTKTPAVARLEAGGGRQHHAPSLATLRKYAAAVGCRLEIKLVPLAPSSRQERGPMEQPRKLFGDVEREAMQRLENELSRHAELTRLIFNAIYSALGRLPTIPVSEMPQAKKVVTALLIRLANDLRSAALLALRGYPLQSAALVSSIYETTYTIAYIGSDEGRAQQWIDHDDPTQPFKNIRALTKETILRLGLPKPEDFIAKQYLIYRQLCMAKHANPLLQQHHGIRREGTYWIASIGPDVTEDAVRVAWFALEHASGLGLMALKSFAIEHLALKADDELRNELEALDRCWQDLHDAAVTRWGTNDPFPGKWKV
jgi:transcriptional regulator with XRE-family HTH domain